MPMERKFVLQKSLTTDTLSSNIHLILVSKKTATKEYGKEDRTTTTKLWDSQQHAQRMEDVNFYFRWEQTGTILFKHMVMKLSLKDKGDLQGQRQGAQSKISVQKKKKGKRHRACSRKVVCQAETEGLW